MVNKVNHLKSWWTLNLFNINEEATLSNNVAVVFLNLSYSYVDIYSDIHTTMVEVMNTNGNGSRVML